ncbi:MAG: CHAP domain-containing protein [Lachnospiraceae bacterium]|nr:CHAP domain-containing protein [Lachnospiraceae bacterium]
MIILFPGTGIRSLADDFAVRTVSPTVEEAYYRHYGRPGGLNQCIVRDSSNGFVLPNCVGYCWGRAYEVLGYRPRLPMINAWEWYDYNRRAYAETPRKGYPYGSEPRTGAIACYNGMKDGHQWGHVLFIERLHGDGTVTISESYFYGAVFSTSRIPVAALNGLYGYNLQGFIYVWPSSESDFQPPATLSHLVVSKTPDVTTYEVGDPVDFSGLIIDAVFSNDTVVNVTSETTLQGHDTSLPGEKQVVASYGGKSVSFTLTVNPHSHVFAGNWNAKDEETHVRKCIKCGEVFSEAHVSSSGENHLFNEDLHYRVCSVCGVKYGIGAHVFSGEAVYGQERVCEVCGYVTVPVMEPETEEETAGSESEEEPTEESSSEEESSELPSEETGSSEEAATIPVSDPTGSDDVPVRNGGSDKGKKTPTVLEKVLAGVVILLLFGGLMTFLILKRRKQ